MAQDPARIVDGRPTRRLRSGREVWADGEDVSGAWGDFVSGLAEWDYFMTLTFDPQRCGEVRNLQQVRRAFFTWVSSVESYLRCRLLYVAAVEAHKSGRLHLHGVVKAARARKPADQYLAWLLWWQRYGRAQVGPFRDRAAACRYAAKYLAKDPLEGGILLSRGLVSSSSRVGRADSSRS
jgi:hypothetical protein